MHAWCQKLKGILNKRYHLYAITRIKGRNEMLYTYHFKFVIGVDNRQGWEVHPGVRYISIDILPGVNNQVHNVKYSECGSGTSWKVNRTPNSTTGLVPSQNSDSSDQIIFNGNSCDGTIILKAILFLYLADEESDLTQLCSRVTSEYLNHTEW